MWLEEPKKNLEIINETFGVWIGSDEQGILEKGVIWLKSQFSNVGD